MSDWPEEGRSAELARRVAELEAENRRLSDLLGLGTKTGQFRQVFGGRHSFRRKGHLWSRG